MKEHNYKMNISQAEFFNILGNHTLKDMPLSNLNRNTASDTTLYGSVNGKSANSVLTLLTNTSLLIR